MAAPRVRVSVPEPTGSAADSLERLGQAAGAAATSAEALGRAQERAGEAAAREAERTRERLADAGRSLIADPARGAAAALGQQGAGATDALFGAISSLQAALPALGSTLGGAVSGPTGAAAGGVAGALAAAGLEREFGPERRAREQAIAEVTALNAAPAAQGAPLSQADLAQALQQAYVAAMRQIENEGSVRSSAGGLF